MEARDTDGTETSGEVYNPGANFEKDTKASHVSIPVSDSTELWLIQCPIGQVKPATFSGKISVNFDNDERLGSITDPSGKSFELVSFASKEPDATLFMPFDSESKVVGKTLRRVCLVRCPEPSDFEKPKLRQSYKPGGTTSLPSFLTPSKGTSGVTFGSSHDTLTSAHTMDHSAQSSRHKQKRARDSPSSSNRTSKSGKNSSVFSGHGSYLVDASLGSAGDKSEKKRADVQQ